jgi:hypothetical protein
MRDRGALVVGCALVALFLIARSSSASPMHTLTSTWTRKGSKLAKPAMTGPGNVKDWAQSRFRAAYKYLLSQGFTNENEEANASQMALSALAHWANETGSGKYEWGYNIGGRHARASDAKYWSGSDAGNAADFPIFDSLEAAVRDYFELVSKGYPSAWALLKSKPTQSDWYEQLGHSGYYGGDPDNAANVWATLRGNLEQYATEN